MFPKRIATLVAAIATSIGLFFTGCNPRPDDHSQMEAIEINPAFSEYITVFTSGVISRESPIRIRLAAPYEGEISYDQPVDQKLFRFSPAISGQAYWMDQQTLEYVPAEPLPSGKIYNGSFALEELIRVPGEFENFKFRFQVIRQTFEVFVDGMNPTDDNNPEWQRVNGVVHTADVADGKEIETVLKASQNGQQLHLIWDHLPNRKMHRFTIDSVARKEKPDNISIAWNGSTIGVKDQAGKIDFKIPSLGDFKLMSASVIQQPDQYLLLQFSDPIHPDQDLNGLITMNGVNRMNHVVEANKIRIYPVHRQTGHKEVNIHEAVKNILGYKLGKNLRQAVVFEDIKPAVRLVGSGNILPASDDLVFPFEAVNLWAVDVRIIKIFENNTGQFFQINAYDGNREMKRVGRSILKKTIRLTPNHTTIDYGSWNRFHIDLNELIKTESGAIYRVEIGFKQNYSTYPCEGEDRSIPEVAEANTTNWDQNDENESSSWDFYDEYYDFDYRERNNPCSRHYYRSSRAVAQNILASDLGIIAKSNTDHSIEVAVTDLKTTRPLSGVTLEVLNYQQQILASATTDAEGRASVKKPDHKPFLLIAKQNNQRGYLRLDDGSSLSLSKFDVEGVHIRKGLKGFIYGERGVWRPGDSLYISFILEDAEKVLPAEHPVTFELINPKGQVTEKIIRISSLNRFYNFSTKTSKNAPTGNWSARVRVGGAVFHKSIKIETIKPNRLKILLNFGKDRLSFRDKNIRGNLNVRWLHGAVARNLKTKIAVTLKPASTTFGKFGDYIFDDPMRTFESEEERIYNDRLDDQGTAEIPAKISVNHVAPGMLNAHFKCRVFEESGDFSVDRFSVPYSPYGSYVGIKLPKGDKARGMLLTDTDHTIEMVTVDENGNPVARSGLDVAIYEINWRWWWEASNDNESNFNGRTSHTPVLEGKTNTNGRGEGQFKFRIKYPDWGRYLVRVTDPVSGHSTGKIVYIDWPGWAGRAQDENPGGASMLIFATDKKKYNVGETIHLTFPSSGVGRALVSVENGSRVMQTHWVEAGEKETRFSIKTTDKMAPNVYLNVTLVQPHAQTANSLPIRLYGVVPVEIVNPATHLQPTIDMPDVLAPEKPVTIKVKEKQGRKMTYTLAVVDEGLLDLTRFKTPDPWQSFYAREALGVKTWDMYDDVIGASGGDVERLLSIGGDESAVRKAGTKANRFKPVVKFLGPFELNPGATGEHTFTMPRYVGSVKTMIIGGDHKAYGHAEKTTPVRTPLMVLATLPRVIGPGETVKLPVSVFAMENEVKKVSVQIQTNPLFTAPDGTRKSITFHQPGDEILEFDLKTVSAIGTGKVTVIAKSGKHQAQYDIEMDVRTPNPRITTVKDGLVKAGQKLDLTFLPPGIDGTNKIAIEVSSLPAMDIQKRLSYLLQYPHGCIEQTTSSVFPQLFVGDVIEVDPATQTKMDNHVKAGLRRLRLFQLPNGGFSYWPGNDKASNWGSTYAGHFMLEAERKGYTLPMGMKNNWIRYQKNTARNWRKQKRHSDSYYRLSDLDQAYRLYTLALANSVDLGAMNRLKEYTDLSPQARFRLGAAYQMAGRPEVAEQLLDGVTTSIAPYKETGRNFGSFTRDLAMIIEALSICEKREKAAPLVKILSENMRSKRWMSTQTTAYALIAATQFVGTDNGNKTIHFNYASDGATAKNKQSRKPVVCVDIERTSASAGQMVIDNKGQTLLYVRIISTGVPAAGQETTAQDRLEMEVVYLNLQGKAIDPSALDQGTDFMARVTVKNPGLGNHYQAMALTQVFPSGWEIRNLRLDGTGAAWAEDQPDYMDIRDDRVMQYFDLRRGKSKTFVVLLNAAYQGKFYLPAVSCEAMYDRTIFAHQAGRWVKVVKPGADGL